MTHDYQLPIRNAAKAVLYSGNTIALVAGKSNRFNLPGGGIDEGESAERALFRELYEELGLEEEHLTDFSYVGKAECVVTSGRGEKMLARWMIFSAQMDIPEAELLLGEDIELFERVSRETALLYTHPHISQLASHAIRIST